MFGLWPMGAISISYGREPMLEPVYKVRVWIRMFAIKACEVEKSGVYWGNRAFFRRA